MDLYPADGLLVNQFLGVEVPSPVRQFVKIGRAYAQFPMQKV